MRKLSVFIIMCSLLYAGCAYGSEYFATTDMTWAEFYAGEVNETSSDLYSQGLDAISTPTTRPAIDRFPLLWAESNDNGTVISGEKAVQVRMSEEVYNLLSNDARYKFTASEFSEYKTVNADGTFSAMTTETANASNAKVSLTSGASATWGQYVLTIKSADANIGLSEDKIARNYLGVLLETSDGKIYGMRHDNNLWSDAETIAFCVNANYTEPHGNGVTRDYDYTSDLAGKTITKITYMLNDLPDVVVSCNITIPSLSTATVRTSASEILAGTGVKIPFRFTGLPDGATYTITTLYSGSGRNRTFFNDWSYADNTLTVNENMPAGNYTAVFHAEGYTDIAATFSVEGYHYAITDMTWAEFYAGETGSTAQELLSAGLDAVSSPTARIAGRFTQLASVSNDLGGRDITGPKDVQVRMNEEVYQALSNDKRYTFTDTVFTEYKNADASGAFSAMLTEYDEQNATVTLSSGAGATWGNYMLNVSGLNITLGSGDTRYYLGALITTSDGKTYGMRHNSNLWFNAGDIALTYKSFTEPHGIARDYDYTSDLEGKTVTRIQYMLKDRPDVVVNCNAFLKLASPASASLSYTPAGYHASVIGYDMPITITFSGLPDGVVYNLASVTPSIRHAAALSPDLYTYSDGKLSINNYTPGIYKALFTTDRYSDLAVNPEYITFIANSDLISDDNNKAGISFMLTPQGYVDSVDRELSANKIVNASEYTSIPANKTESYTAGANQISGSGFSFDIVVSGVSSDYTAIAGFGYQFIMTRATLGDIYDKVYSAINAIPVGESGWREIPSLSALNSAGLRAVQVMPGGTSRDISAMTGTGANINGENITLFYGSMTADSNSISEGEYVLSPEGEYLINDGARDGHIRTAIYLEKIQSSSENPSSEPETPTKSPDVEPENPGGTSPTTPDNPSTPDETTSLNLNDTAITSRIRQNLGTTSQVRALPADSLGSSRTESDLTAEELTAIPASEDIVAVLPQVSAETSAVYVWEADLNSFSVSEVAAASLSENTKIFLHMPPAEKYMLLDDTGAEIDSVPASGIVNIAAYLEAGKVYSPVITSAASAVDPGSAGGGCSLGCTAGSFAFLALLMKKH